MFHWPLPHVNSFWFTGFSGTLASSKMSLCDFILTTKQHSTLLVITSSKSAKKHIKLGCYPICKKIYDGLIQTCHVASIDHVSNIVTKPLGKYQFHHLSGKLGIHDIFTKPLGLYFFQCSEFTIVNSCTSIFNKVCYYLSKKKKYWEIQRVSRSHQPIYQIFPN